MSIVNECMIVNLQVGVWLGYRLDKQASLAITSQAHADSDAARVNKHIVPKETLKPIVTAAGCIRTHFYDKTLPWKDNGDRLLTRKMYAKYIEEHSRLVKDFDSAVDDFLTHTYLRARDQAEFRMGALFNPADYPSTTTLRHKFYVNLDIDAVTTANDFRVALSAKEADRIRTQMAEGMQERMGKAMQDVWQRLADTVQHFSAKMQGDEVFRDSTVRNLEEIVELLPDLNILNDQNLEKIRLDIKHTLTGYTPKDLRKDKTTRKLAAYEAQRIIDSMSGFMNAFGGAA